MTETHSMRLNIDGSGAQKGAAAYKSAVNQIIASTQAMKTALNASGGGKSNANFKDIAKGLNEISRIKIDGSNAANLRNLSAALSSFKGPSTGAVKNTRQFFRDLATVQLNKSIGSNLAAISQAMAQFKGPSQSGVKNTKDFLNQLNKATLNTRVATQLGVITTALSGFKGPSATSAKNLAAFFAALNKAGVNSSAASGISHLASALATMPAISAASSKNLSSLVASLNNLKAPQNINGLVSVLHALTGALGAAQSSSARFSTTIRSVPFSHASSSARQLAGDMRGLENAFSSSYQIGSQLRVLFGSLTLGQFTTNVYNAQLQTQRFAQTVAVTTPNLAEAGKTIDEVRRIVNQYGLDMATTMEEFGKFSTSAKLAGQTTEEVMYIYESFGGAMRVMGLEASRQQLVWKALTQMFSKGKVSAEELNQQLGDQLPGAFTMLQTAIRKATGDSTASLANLLKQGKVSSNAVILLAKAYREQFADQVAAASDRVDAKIGRMSSAWFEFQVAVADSGLTDAIGRVADQFTTILRDGEFRALAVSIGSSLSTAILKVGELIQIAGQNASTTLAILGGFAAFTAFSRLAGMIGGVTTALKVMAAAARGGTASMAFLTGVPALAALAVTGLVMYSDAIIKVGNTTTTLGTLADQTFRDIGNVISSTLLNINNWSLSAVTDEIGNFYLATASSFDLITLSADQNAKLTASAWTNAFKIAMASGQAFTTKVLTSGLQLGSAAKNYATYQAKSLMGGDKDALWKDFVTTTKTEFDSLEGVAADTYKSIIDDWKLTEKDLNVDAAMQAAMKRANDLKTMRDAQAREDERRRKQGAADEARDNAMKGPELDLSKVNPLMTSGDDDDGSGSGSGSGKGGKPKNSVAKRMRDNAQATRDYHAEVGALVEQLREGTISLEQYNAAMEGHARNLQEQTDPYSALVRSITEENNLLGMSRDAQEQERAVREARNALLEKGRALTDAEAESIRKLVAQQQELNKGNPYKDYVDSIEKFGRATDEIAVKAVDGLADQIASMVSTGKADFASLAQSILGMFIKSGLQTLFKQFWGDAWGGAKKAEQQSVSTPASSFTDAASSWVKSNFASTPMRSSFDQGGDPTLATQAAGRQALASDAMPMRGGLDIFGNWDKTSKVASTDPNSWINNMYSTGRSSGLTDIQARVMSSQAALESGYGKSALATQANNYFGIKAGNGWTGPTMLAPSKEQRPDGSWVTENSAFRKYGSMEEGLADKASLMKSNFPGAYNASNWADAMSGLKNGRLGAYATDQGYAAKLAAINSKINPGATGLDMTSTSSVSGPGTIKQMQGLNWDGRMMSGVNGLTLHHTGGRGTPQGVVSTLNQRGLGAQYVMDRDGTIYQTGPDMARMSHMKNAENGSGLSNNNALGMEMIAKDNNDLTPAQIQGGQVWIEKMRSKYPGIGDNVFGHGELNRHKQDTEGMGVVNAWRQNRQSSMTAGGQVDPQTTSSIQQANTTLTQLGTQAQTTAQQIQQSSQLQQMSTQQKIAADQQAASSLQNAGAMATEAAPKFDEAGNAIANAGQSAAKPAAESGMSLGSLSGLVSSVVPGAGQYTGIANQLLSMFGLFSEGGYSTDPVAFGKMPHYAEGTANTGSYGRGGIPSVLHPNEAVIPLSRGRKVPVEMNTSGESQSSQSEFAASRGGGNTFNLNLSGLKGADDFRKNQRQINAKMASDMQRAQRRNA